MPVFVGFSTFFRIPEAAEDPESGYYRSPDRVFPRFSALKYKKIAQSAVGGQGVKEHALAAMNCRKGSLNSV
jgi:hypothetical protein